MLNVGKKQLFNNLFMLKILLFRKLYTKTIGSRMI
jgi:hypothetical protein